MLSIIPRMDITLQFKNPFTYIREKQHSKQKEVGLEASLKYRQTCALKIDDNGSWCRITGDWMKV